MRQFVHKLTHVVMPDPLAAGRLRQARSADTDLVVEWILAFDEDAGVGIEDAPGAAARLIERGALYLWDDAEPRSMAAVVRETRTGVSITLVYTPRTFRGHGYASACVATLSRQLLESGRSFCSLWTDLANPTSNALYARLGYVPLADIVDVEFHDV